MKTLIASIVLLVTISINMSGQSISFNYDADGNMESRNVVPLKSSKSSEDIITANENNIIDLPAKSINIYPNPTKGQIIIDITPLDGNEDNYLLLYNAGGMLICSRKITSSRMQLEITGAQGIYFLNVHIGTDVSKWKIIKQ